MRVRFNMASLMLLICDSVLDLVYTYCLLGKFSWPWPLSLGYMSIAIASSIGCDVKCISRYSLRFWGTPQGPARLSLKSTALFGWTVLCDTVLSQHSCVLTIYHRKILSSLHYWAWAMQSLRRARAVCHKAMTWSWCIDCCAVPGTDDMRSATDPLLMSSEGVQ